jgi:2-polyprenyl-3-methyl-5-hydroxy-6-metoxy-1,4-benzoquinol methylase
MYETANYNIFRAPPFANSPNYFVSEYFEDHPLGTRYRGIRNENIECLTFPDGYFDILITSEVLEHVADLDRTLEEIRRVLKPGGFHVFSIPVDLNLEKTVERAKIVSKKVVHLLPPEMHGDTIRSEGILAFRDFGKDVLEYLARDGFHYAETRHSRSGMLLTSVYHARRFDS